MLKSVKKSCIKKYCRIIINHAFIEKERSAIINHTGDEDILFGVCLGVIAGSDSK